jgi:hypothetical protein
VVVVGAVVVVALVAVEIAVVVGGCSAAVLSPPHPATKTTVASAVGMRGRMT